jgi:saccharopine dehydrogenase-like NADP-dependent oxidoreductase
VIGAGGLGSWILASLAAAGVGRLLICDHDVVEASNLNRQILFTAADVGRSKTATAAAWLRALDPSIAVDTVELAIEGADDVNDLAERADLVINCADRPSVAATSDWVAAACLAGGVPHIVGGGYAYHVGSLGLTVLPGRTPCWACARAAVGTNGTAIRGRTGPGPSLAMFSAVIANLLAWDAARVLLGLRPAAAGRLGELDFRTFAVRWRDIPFRPDCPCTDWRNTP